MLVENKDILIIEMYHSGTGPAGKSSELVSFLQKASLNTTILMGTFPKEYIDVPYDSTLALKSAGAKVYSDLQTHYLYVLSVLTIASNMDVDKLSQTLSSFEL